jgi:hypothetical protein
LALEVDGGAVEEDLATFELASTLCRDLAGAERGDSLPVAVEPLGEVEEAVAIGCRGNLVNAALLVGRRLGRQSLDVFPALSMDLSPLVRQFGVTSSGERMQNITSFVGIKRSTHEK